MKILFIGLASHYTEGMTYQDNMLASQCVQDGHEVYYISDTECYHNGKLVKVEAGQKKLPDSVTLYRVEHDYIINGFISDKLRGYKEIYKILEAIKPDMIFLHGSNTITVWKIAKYLRKNPEVRFFVDSHADYYTSGTVFLSRFILHGIICRMACHKCLKYADKLFCISMNCMKFAEEVYKIPIEKLEFYPLGGNVLEEKDLEEKRLLVRKNLKWSDKDIIFLQAGKIDAAKCLLESLDEFVRFSAPEWKYVIAGSLSPDIEIGLKKVQAHDSRIIYLGWKSGDEVMDCLAGCDVYLQPGKVSALAQNAICMGAAVALRNYEDYKVMVQGNGWLLDRPEDVRQVFRDISEERVNLKELRRKSYEQAQKVLSYKKRTERLYCQEVPK